MTFLTEKTQCGTIVGGAYNSFTNGTRPLDVFFCARFTSGVREYNTPWGNHRAVFVDCCKLPAPERFWLFLTKTTEPKMSKELTFQNNILTTKIFDGEIFVKSTDIAKALGYSDTSRVSQLYRQYQDEFEPSMIRTVESTALTKVKYKTLYFNRRGAWLIGMFARTSIAKDFRKWILDVLEERVPNVPVTQEETNINGYKKLLEKRFSSLSSIKELSVMMGAINFKENGSQRLQGKLLSEMKEKINTELLSISGIIHDAKYQPLVKNLLQADLK